MDFDTGFSIASERTGQILNEEDSKRLAALAELLRKSGVDVQIEQLADSGIRQTLDECQTRNAELIIVGSQHHSALYHLVVGSPEDEVLRTAHSPVLVVPAAPVRQDLARRENHAPSHRLRSAISLFPTFLSVVFRKCFFCLPAISTGA